MPSLYSEERDELASPTLQVRKAKGKLATPAMTAMRVVIRDRQNLEADILDAENGWYDWEGELKRRWWPKTLIGAGFWTKRPMGKRY